VTRVLGEAYRGKAVLITGGTGFLGTALVEKMLRSLPSLRRLYLLVRPSRDKGARERFETDVLGSPAFSRLREELGAAFDEWVREKVRVLEGDVHSDSLGLGSENLAELSQEVDAVVHSAASVVFDAPLEAALHARLDLVRGGDERGTHPGGGAQWALAKRDTVGSQERGRAPRRGGAGGRRGLQRKGDYQAF
jgi:NAD(P)-dependent dehydrogenase (short-subunit alcohol dehydrogenase family)